MSASHSPAAVRTALTRIAPMRVPPSGEDNPGPGGDRHPAHGSGPRGSSVSSTAWVLTVSPVLPRISSFLSSEQDRSGGATAGAVAVVRRLVVVEAQEAVEGALELREVGGVAAAELHAPVLVKDRALQALDGAVGPGMAGLGPRVTEAELLAGRREGPPRTRCRGR